MHARKSTHLQVRAMGKVGGKVRGKVRGKLIVLQARTASNCTAQHSTVRHGDSSAHEKLTVLSATPYER